MATTSGRGGTGGAVVVQRATCVFPVLLLFGGYGSGPGHGWRGSAFYSLLRCGILGSVAFGCRFNALPPGSGGPHEAAAQFCCTGHGMRTQPETHRPAADRRNCGSLAVAFHWLGTADLWDHAARSQPVRYVSFWDDPLGQWGCGGARCDGVWSGGLCGGKEKHKKTKKKT